MNGIALSVSVIRRVTEQHAGPIQAYEEALDLPAGSTRGKTFVGEMDGTMLWKEVRLCLVHPQGSATPVFGSTAADGADASGQHWARCA